MSQCVEVQQGILLLFCPWPRQMRADLAQIMSYSKSTPLSIGPMIDTETYTATGWGSLTLTHWVLSLGQARTAAVFGFKAIPPPSPKKH